MTRAERMREQKVRLNTQHLPGHIICCTHLSTMSLGFTLPYLDGSKPLHSFVLSNQGVESD